jgi:hypothetical protein
MRFVVDIVIHLRKQNSELLLTLNTLTALDLIAHELSGSQAEKNQWYKTDKNCVIWHSLSHNKDIGLYHNDKKLVRTIGIYSSENNSWSSKHTSVIADSIEDFKLEYQWDTSNHEQINLITCWLTRSLLSKRAYTAHRSIALCNRYF